MADIKLKNQNGEEITYDNINSIKIPSATEGYAEFIQPSGEITITSNDTYDVTNYESAIVDVQPSGSTGAVRYDEVQSLTDAQKEQARNNINAVEGDGEGTTLQDIIDAIDDCETPSNKVTNLDYVFTDDTKYPSAKSVKSYLELDEGVNNIQHAEYKEKGAIGSADEALYRSNSNQAKKNYPSIYALMGYVDRKISEAITDALGGSY